MQKNSLEDPITPAKAGGQYGGFDGPDPKHKMALWAVSLVQLPLALFLS